MSVTDGVAGHETGRPHRATAAIVVVPAILALALAAWVAVVGWAVPSPKLETEPVSLVRTAGTSPRGDVEVTRCSNAVFVGAAAWGQVANGSSRGAAYRISLAFDDAHGEALATAAVTVDTVEPGATARWQASGFVDDGVVTDCRIVSVERLPS